MFRKDPLVVLAESRAELTRYIVDFDYVTHDESNLRLALVEIERLDKLLKELGGSNVTTRISRK